jgi:hypothetical protein
MKDKPGRPPLCDCEDPDCTNDHEMLGSLELTDEDEEVRDDAREWAGMDSGY